MRAGSPRPGHRASILGIPGRSRSRPHLSLWEGSETAPRSGAEKPWRWTYEMAGAPVGKNPLSPRTAWWRIGPRR